MKTLKIMNMSQGGALLEFDTRYWQELITIDDGRLDEDSNSYTIYLTNGKKLSVDKRKVYSEDNLRTIYVGSMGEISNSEFRFTKMKWSTMHELWDMYWDPNQGGFYIICSVA